MNSWNLNRQLILRLFKRNTIDTENKNLIILIYISYICIFIVGLNGNINNILDNQFYFS